MCDGANGTLFLVGSCWKPGAGGGRLHSVCQYLLSCGDTNKKKAHADWETTAFCVEERLMERARLCTLARASRKAVLAAAAAVDFERVKEREPAAFEGTATARILEAASDMAAEEGPVGESGRQRGGGGELYDEELESLIHSLSADALTALGSSGRNTTTWARHAVLSARHHFCRTPLMFRRSAFYTRSLSTQCLSPKRGDKSMR
jgi:hypothetical protein